MIKKLILFISVVGVILLTPFLGCFFHNSGYIELNREIESPLFEQYREKNLLIFFGYVGCLDICIPRLNELSSVYNEIKSSKQDVKIIFVNLSGLQDKELADLFAKSFNNDFIGLEIEKKELENLKKEFRVFSAPSLGDSSKIDHTSFLYLLENVNSKYYVKRIYTKFPFNSANVAIGNNSLKNR